MNVSRREELIEEASRILASVVPSYQDADAIISSAVLNSCGLNIADHCGEIVAGEDFSPTPVTPDLLLHDPAGFVLLMRGTIYNLASLQRAHRLPRPACRNGTPANAMEDLFSLEWDAADERLLPILSEMEGMYALILARPGGEVVLARDPMGMKSLYIGSQNGKLIAGFDLKTVAASAEDVAAFPPGYVYSSRGGLRPFWVLSQGMPDKSHSHTVSREMLALLTHSVRASLPTSGPSVSTGILLSGGVASSIITSIASRFRPFLNSVTVGVAGGSDLSVAREVATALGTTHCEHVVTPAEVVDALPEIIFHLETFRPSTVRRALAYYFAARAAREAGITVVLSGDGANALFAGDVSQTGVGGDGGRIANPGDAYQLHQEVLRRTACLHRTNLPGADRMGHAHGLEVRLPYLDAPSLVNLALQITADLKVGMMDDKKLLGTGVPRKTRFGKRVLREIAMDLLPHSVASLVALRPRIRFEQGAGFKNVLMRHVNEKVSDKEFFHGRELAPGVRLRNKEEFHYYQIFREMFPVERVLSLVMETSSDLGVKE